MRKTLLTLRLMLALPMLLAVPGCVQSPPISAPPPACSNLIPTDWGKGVAHAAAPAEASDPLGQLKAWIGFGVAEAGNVEIANQRQRDTLGIIQRCEARDAAAVRPARHRLFGIL